MESNINNVKKTYKTNFKLKKSDENISINISR